MQILDEKFKHDKLRYFLQCALATVAMLVTLSILRAQILLDGVDSNAALIASLGASSCIVFITPHARSACGRILIGGYVVGIAAGALCFWIARFVPLPARVGLIEEFPDVVFGSGAVGLAIFVMVITNTEHPPAAGVALGFVLLDEWRWMTVLVVLAGVVVLSMVRRVLKPALRSLA